MTRFLVLLAVCFSLGNAYGMEESKSEDTNVAPVKSYTPGSNKAYAFLIEGCGSHDAEFTEIPIAILAAKEIGASYFDIIHSFNYEFHKRFILGKWRKGKELSEEEQKEFAVVEFKFFGTRFTNKDEFVNDWIATTYSRMEEDKLLKKPDWVKNIDAKKMEKLSSEIGSTSDLLNRGIEYSNLISAETFMDFVSKNKDLQVVRGIIGFRHLPFLDHFKGDGIKVEVAHSTDTFRWLKITLGERMVYVHLHGGLHGDPTHIKSMLGAVIIERKLLSQSTGQLELLLNLAQLSSTNKSMEPARSCESPDSTGKK